MIFSDIRHQPSDNQLVYSNSFNNKNMIKIIETYSGRIVANVIINIQQCSLQANNTGLVLPSASIEKSIYDMKTSTYSSTEARESTVLKRKLEVINSDGNGFLLIVRHADINLCMRQYPLYGVDILHDISVNSVPFFTAIPTAPDINKDVLNKMNRVLELVSSYDESNVATSLIIQGLITSYTGTGIVSKEDLEWMNRIYNKYR